MSQSLPCKPTWEDQRLAEGWQRRCTIVLEPRSKYTNTYTRDPTGYSDPIELSVDYLNNPLTHIHQYTKRRGSGALLNLELIYTRLPDTTVFR